MKCSKTIIKQDCLSTEGRPTMNKIYRYAYCSCEDGMDGKLRSWISYLSCVPCLRKEPNSTIIYITDLHLMTDVHLLMPQFVSLMLLAAAPYNYELHAKTASGQHSASTSAIHLAGVLQTGRSRSASRRACWKASAASHCPHDRTFPATGVPAPALMASETYDNHSHVYSCNSLLSKMAF